MRRRDLLVIGGAIGIAVAIPPILRRLPTEFVFEPLPGLDGFRRVQSGAVSGGFDPFLGLSDVTEDEALSQNMRIGDLCHALYGKNGWRSGTMPVAIFTDINCPYCRVLEGHLKELRDTEGSIDLFWHEMPLLGPSSVRAARAMLAARARGKEDAARGFLARHPLPPGPVGLNRLALALKLQPDDLRREMDGAQVSAALAESMALGRRLGVVGTPATVIGRTLVIGSIRVPDLRKLVAIEMSEPNPVCG